MLKMDELQTITYSLAEIKDDSSIPKNVRENIEKTIIILGNNSETSIKINKALDLIGDVADDINLQPYTRTQLLDIVSILERL